MNSNKELWLMSVSYDEYVDGECKVNTDSFLLDKQRMNTYELD